jgi:hypothetical protein
MTTTFNAELAETAEIGLGFSPEPGAKSQL